MDKIKWFKEPNYIKCKVCQKIVFLKNKEDLSVMFCNEHTKNVKITIKEVN